MFRLYLGGLSMVELTSNNNTEHTSSKTEDVNKVVLLYSGGLDTSILVKWIQDHYDAEVIALTIDIGQPDARLDEVKEKALELGAKDAVAVDAKEEFADDYISKAIKANGLYQGQYPLSTAIARPLKSKIAVDVAKEKGADAVAHGSTGKGNDQVRFEVSIEALAPDLKVIAPVREMEMTRDKELEYAKEKGIPVPNDVDSPYSTDENLWGRSIECGVLEHPDQEYPDDIFKLVTTPEKAPDEPEYVTMEFEEGLPVSLNGEEKPLHSLIAELNEIAGKHGVGIVDMTEDRVVGLKSREIYECPAAITIVNAHSDLEKFVSTSHQNSFKPNVDQRWSELAYEGLWVDPLMENMEAFLDSFNKKVSGEVRVKLYKGSAKVVGRESENALYDHNLATYQEGETFSQESSPGFIELWGLQSRMANEIEKGE